MCSNRLAVPMERVDAAILATLASDVLGSAVVDAVIEGVLNALEPGSQATEADARRAELVVVERALSRLTAGGPLAPLVDAIKERQARREGLIADIAAAEAANVGFNRRSVERQVRAKLKDWRGLLTRNTQDGRELLRRILAGPVHFIPEGAQYRFEGEAAIGRLLTGVVDVSTYVASRRR